MSLEKTLEYIHKVKWQGMKPGLERTNELLAALGNPHKSLKFVHIAGTNGKGSTAACIAAVLQMAGYRTGLYTSPYIHSFNERMQINGEYITDDELIEMTDRVRPHADNMSDAPTEFELITSLAMLYFLHKECDIVVLEVGMGGELDSTNVIDVPEVAVITLIGYDHVKELGPTIEDIARAKAGIIKGGDVVVYDDVPDVKAVFECVAAKKNARLRVADFSRISNEKFSLSESNFIFEPYGEISLPLVGTYQPKNAAVAITALEVLREKGYTITDGDIVDGLKSVRWQGRFEVLGHDPVFILDGAHNPQGIEAVSLSLEHYFKDRKIVFILGVMADKDIDSMILPIVPLAKAFVTVRPNNPRAMSEVELAKKLFAHNVPAAPFSSISAGVENAIKLAGEDGIVCAVGSLFLSGDIRKAYEELGVRSLCVLSRRIVGPVDYQK